MFRLSGDARFGRDHAAETLIVAGVVYGRDARDLTPDRRVDAYPRGACSLDEVAQSMSSRLSVMLIPSERWWYMPTPLQQLGARRLVVTSSTRSMLQSMWPRRIRPSFGRLINISAIMSSVSQGPMSCCGMVHASCVRNSGAGYSGSQERPSRRRGARSSRVTGQRDRAGRPRRVTTQIIRAARRCPTKHLSWRPIGHLLQVAAAAHKQFMRRPQGGATVVAALIARGWR